MTGKRVGIGLLAEEIRLKYASASWTISFKFVSVVVFCVKQSADISPVFPGMRIGLNRVISISKSPNAGCSGRVGSALSKQVISAAQKYIVVNPMITESA